MQEVVVPVVLVVDDDRAQVALVTAVLRKAGFRVLSASSPLAALAALKVAGEAIKGISVLVTDLDMPGMSGLTFAAELVTRHPGLKVLYLTAKADALFQDAPALKPHEAFLEKPVSAQALREAVNLLL
jgi:two-component system, cell cycle sensor histidine kinase and response regulator CckA